MIQTRVTLAVTALTLVLGACAPTGDPPVASPPAQSPAPATRESKPSRSVAPERPSRPPIPRDLRRLARAFIDYALGGPDTQLPTAETVAIGLDGRPLVSVDEMPWALSDRSIWEVCPGDAEYHAGFSCPIDLLAPLQNTRRNDAQLVVTRDPEAVCALPRVTAPRGRYVVIRPERAWRTCASDFALVLNADGRGRLTSALLTVSEP